MLLKSNVAEGLDSCGHWIASETPRRIVFAASDCANTVSVFGQLVASNIGSAGICLKAPFKIKWTEARFLVARGGGNIESQGVLISVRIMRLFQCASGYSNSGVLFWNKTRTAGKFRSSIDSVRSAREERILFLSWILRDASRIIMFSQTRRYYEVISFIFIILLIFLPSPLHSLTVERQFLRRLSCISSSRKSGRVKSNTRVTAIFRESVVDGCRDFTAQREHHFKQRFC